MEDLTNISKSDLDKIESLDLDDHLVLNALARLCGIHLETVDPKRTRWYATPKMGATFRGTYAEVRSFIRGYALCYRWALAQQAGEREAILRSLEKIHQDAELAR